ncbi:MAG TPA: amino acid adenylation domain-containing protein, partial [Ktedonobacteraceae bacterium]|nr:amino acid adenylation domain-containing protein [Ktedonobacteraceae bacterium]
LEQLWLLLEQQPEQVPESGVQAENIAYVIYTSGSTGQPKGAMNLHRAACNHLLWLCRQFAINEQDHVLQKTPFSFDASIWEFFVPLVSGARLVLAQPEGQRDSSYLVEVIAREGVTIVQFVPSMLQIFLEEPAVEQCTSLRHVMSGGETLSYELQERFFARSRAAFHNLYGPTEASIDVTHWECERRSKQRIVPIGRPISNIQTYVLDERMRVVPIGVLGELYIGGIGIARGYYRRPELTAEHFVPHPWSQEPGARLYQTGDLVRYRSDGAIEFVGRIDQQVKIRGYRIELGEIEAVLTSHLGIREAVVLIREDALGDKRLVAYVVEEGSKALAVADLRRHLQEKLPDYMGPAFFVLLEALPLTSNGKVDRRALPPPERSEFGTDNWVAARTPVEEVVLAIYREVLGTEQVSIHDNFFDLGGHSLLAIQVISRIRAVMGVELSVRSLFETPSVAGLAKQIEQNLRSGQERAIPPLVPQAREQGLPLSFAQQRLWFQEQLISDYSAYVLPLTVRLDGPLHVTVLEECLQEMVHRHESLRTTFVTRLGQPAQMIHADLRIELAVIDLQAIEEDKQFPEVLQFLKKELLHPFDLNNGPLLRMGLLRLQDQG